MHKIVPNNDLKRLYDRIGTEVESAVLETLRTGWWINGKAGERFSSDFAKFVGVKHCIPVANGTDALELALRTLRTGEEGRNEVITVANAGGYTSTACYQVGAVPVYADIEPESQLISIPSVVAALGAQTAVIVATHLYGGAVDIVELRRAVDAAGYKHVPILEDCAQAHGARLGNAAVGSLGDIATFSFYPSKNLGAMGDGGSIVCSDDTLAQRARMLHQYGWESKYKIALKGGRNSRMDEVQAAILSTLLPHLPSLNLERQRIRDQYRSAASASIQFVDGGPGAVVHLAVVRVDDRTGFRSYLADRQIASEVHYPILDTDQPAWTDQPHRVSATGLPHSKASVNSIVSLPCFPGLTAEEIQRVSLALTEWKP